MPVYNVTVDDSSPMIIYSQGWVDSNSSDPRLSSYSGQTFHASSNPDAKASFSFFGNAVYLFGANRAGYGPYNVSLDDQNTSGNAASGDGLFQQVLFNRTGMANDQHTLVLTNNGIGTTVDVDFIIFTTGDGNSTTQPMNTTIDDTVPQISYTPEISAWDTTSSVAASYHNASLHESQIQGSQVVVPFTGDAVSVYGSTSQSHGTFSVRIDDRETVQLNGSAPNFRPQTLLYMAAGLDSGQHQLAVTNTQDQLFVDFDFLVATSWTSLASPPPSPVPAHQSTAKTPIIAGVISGTCVGIAWVLAFFFLLRRRRRRRRQLLTADLAEAKPEPFILPPDPAVVDGSHRPGDYAFGNVSAGKGYPPRAQGVQPSPASTSSHLPASTSSSPQTRPQGRSLDSGIAASNASVSSSRISAASPAVASSRVLASSHVMAPASIPESSSSKEATSTTSPATQSDTRPSISTAELSASRMTVPNRPQDWGPIIPLPHEEHEEGLPPDYQQATQPMPPVTTPSSQ